MAKSNRQKIAMNARRFAVWREMQDIRGRTIAQMAAEIGIHASTFRNIMVEKDLKMPPREEREDHRDESEIGVDEIIGAERPRMSYLQERNLERRVEQCRVNYGRVPHTGLPVSGHDGMVR